MTKTFRRILLAMTTVATTYGFAACSDDDEVEVPPFAHVTDFRSDKFETKTFDSAGGAIDVNIESNADWTLASTETAIDWVTFSPDKASRDATVTITVAPNQTIELRTAKFDVLAKGEALASFTINQTGINAALSVTPQAETIPAEGGEFSFVVVCNTEWSYTIDNSDVTEVEKTAENLKLNFPEAGAEEVSYKINFSYGDKSSELVIKQEARKQPSRIADLLDIQFLPDGSAIDVSPMHNNVITTPGAALMTYYSDTHKRYVANFRHPMGVSVLEGYYRVNYTKGGEFINRIADGCTFETTIRLNEADDATKEVKWFSSMQAGGIGFILPIHKASDPRTKCLTFLPNVSPAGTSNWRWTYSDVEPLPGYYYHVVGVWNKQEGKSYIYINGRLSGTADAPGVYVPVANGAESFIIGGDPANNQTECQSSWNGEIVTARIYDDPFTADQVAELWQEAAFDENAALVSVTDLQYLTECEVAQGYTYNIYGNGFAAGDVIEFQSVASGSKYQAQTVVANDHVGATIPSGLTSGLYKVVLKRGSSQMPLFQVNFTVTSDPVAPVIPKIIAHRGEHIDGASENSIAALKKAMDSNYYGIELDVWITTDGRLVVHHDGVVNNRYFYASTYDQLKDIRLSNGEPLPTLDDFISSFKAKMGSSSSKLIVEIKTHKTLDRSLAATDKAMEMLAEAGLNDRVEYIAFSYDVCKRIVANRPEAMVGYLSGDKAPATILADGIRSIDYSSTALSSHPEWIKEARKLGMIANVWTVNTAPDMLKFMGLGVDYITTDKAALLRTLTTKVFVEP